MSSSEPRPEFETQLPSAGESPLHGFQGNRAPLVSAPRLPAGIAVAVSREAGSRGATIARRVGRKLGWQVYNQELLGYIAQEGPFREGLLANLLPTALQWAEDRLQQLSNEGKLSQEPSIIELARTVLAVCAQGQVVMLGRGSGCILPPASTLNVRILCPLNDRIAYMSQWLRLTMHEAAEQVRVRDHNRAEFIRTHFRSEPTDVYQYDLLLNTNLLREDQCVDLIVEAAKSKQAAWLGEDRETRRQADMETGT